MCRSDLFHPAGWSLLYVFLYTFHLSSVSWYLKFLASVRCSEPFRPFADCSVPKQQQRSSPWWWDSSCRWRHLSFRNCTSGFLLSAFNSRNWDLYQNIIKDICKSILLEGSYLPSDSFESLERLICSCTYERSWNPPLTSSEGTEDNVSPVCPAPPPAAHMLRREVTSTWTFWPSERTAAAESWTFAGRVRPGRAAWDELMVDEILAVRDQELSAWVWR